MAVTNTIHEPFAHTDVAAIVTAIHGRLGTTEGLKETVLSELLDILEVNTIPERVQVMGLSVLPTHHQSRYSSKGTQMSARSPYRSRITLTEIVLLRELAFIS